jgi:orotate phosphoribosyltransferase-like protein
MFSEGRTLVEDEQRTKTRTGDNTVSVRELARSYRRFTVKMAADELNMNRETVRLILTEELGMKKSCAKMSPRSLTQQQWHS